MGPRPADLAGRWAVVTGAAHGIGRGVAARLVDCGADVVAVDTDVEALEATCAELGCVAVAGDLGGSDPGGLADQVLAAAHGPVDLIVDNVGVNLPFGFLDLEPSDFDRAVRTNLRGPWFFTRRLVQALIDADRGGSVVFVSSLHDTVPALRPSYSATKAAVAMLVRELAYELGRHRIRVNAVSPGSIRTQSNPIPVDEDPSIARLIAAGRSGDPDDVAKLVVVLLSDAWAGYVTGVNLPVDGGLGLHSWLMDE
jgi:NAD(P)-dependent dehydrogenase (short-subunit alcohol dehydrogenase family)